MVISGFDWYSSNFDHISRHEYTPDEVRRTRDKLYIALGETLDGRLAFIVFRRLRAGVIRVVTARDMEDRERRLFRRK